MTNPNDAIGTNGAFGGRTSVNAFNDVLGAFQSRGVLSGWGIAPSSGMTVACGGNGTTRDVAVAEDTNGNKTTVNNISGSPVNVTLDSAPASNSRYDAIVVYVDKPPTGNATQDNPECCGIIKVTGTAASTPAYPNDGAIRSAITADGASGATAYYAVIGYVLVASGTTTITSGMIYAVTPATITSDKVDWQTSTAEKRVGTDYDGSAIYERTFVDTNVTFAANTSNSFSLVLVSDPLVPKKIVAAFGNVAGVQYSGGPVIQYSLGAIRLASGSITFNSNVLFSSSGSLQLSVYSQQPTPGTGYYRVTVRYTR